MPPRRKTGRAAAEAAYANLLKENTTLVGDVGEAFDALTAKLEEAAAARDRYEEARAAAVKGWCRHERSTRSDGLQEDLEGARTAEQTGRQHRPGSSDRRRLAWATDQRCRTGAAAGVHGAGTPRSADVDWD